MIAAIVAASDWRWVFYITGAAGFVWALTWWWFYQRPGLHPMITAEERALLTPNIEGAASMRPTVPWLPLLKVRQIQGLLIAKFLTDSAWFFLLFWLPKYLADVRGLDIKQIGYYAWIPYAFSGFGSSVGGWLGGHLIERGYSVDASRKITLAIAACLMPAAIGIGWVPLSAAIVLFSIVMLAHQFWSTIMQTLPTDLFPSNTVGSIAGLMGAAGSFGGMLFNLAVGEILTRYHSYLFVFAAAGVLHLISFGLIVWIVGRIQPVPAEKLPS